MTISSLYRLGRIEPVNGLPADGTADSSQVYDASSCYVDRYVVVGSLE
jgi:hypothetical protein